MTTLIYCHVEIWFKILYMNQTDWYQSSVLTSVLEFYCSKSHNVHGTKNDKIIIDILENKVNDHRHSMIAQAFKDSKRILWSKYRRIILLLIGFLRLFLKVACLSKFSCKDEISMEMIIKYRNAKDGEVIQSIPNGFDLVFFALTWGLVFSFFSINCIRFSFSISLTLLLFFVWLFYPWAFMKWLFKHQFFIITYLT